MSADRQPIVAVVGRPNVGKSTLFNRLVGQRLAIVHDQPGVTRDRSYADAVSFGRRYTVIDTGGFDPDSDDELQLGIDRQIEIAVAEADVIVCVLDATTPPTAADTAQTARLRQAGKPVLFVANKCDSQRHEHEGHDLYRLGMEQLLFVSALHGRGFGELDRALAEALPPLPAEPAEPADEAGAELRVAVVGRPNAGKSSLINRLLGQERLLVDARPGTTRDPIDSLVERRGRRFIFVDTAGLRRKAQVARGRDTVEALSVISAIRAIDRSRLVVLLVDAELGLAEQDTKIVGLALDRGRAIVIGLNKMDKLDAEGRTAALRQARETLSFAPWAPVTTLCAKSGRGVDRLLDLILKVSREFGKRIGTGQLNRFFETVLATHPPPIHKGRAPRFYYITQPQTCPPTFVVMTSHPDSLHFSYQRYVQNSIRQSFGFEGTPIRVHYRRPDRRPAKKSRRGRR